MLLVAAGSISAKFSIHQAMATNDFLAVDVGTMLNLQPFGIRSEMNDVCVRLVAS